MFSFPMPTRSAATSRGADAGRYRGSTPTVALCARIGDSANSVSIATAIGVADPLPA